MGGEARLDPKSLRRRWRINLTSRMIARGILRYGHHSPRKGILCVDSRVDLEAAVAAMGGGGPAAAVAVALGVVAVAAVAENQLVVAGGTLGVVLLALATRKKKTLARL